MINESPQITIGMPVYNGERTLRLALNSLAAQTFKNFELIISDNCSTDSTRLICEEFASKDQRIRYVRQEKNLGGLYNFKFVFDQAKAPYFVWSASDDIRSVDFLAVNYKFLNENPDYSLSASPNGFENWAAEQPLVNFTLNGNVYQRHLDFFNNCFNSHGLFYSLFRTKILKECELLHMIFPGKDWLGFDWAIIMYLSSKGRINRTKEGFTIFGVYGESSGPEIYKKYNSSTIEWFFPFYKLSKIIYAMVKNLTFYQRLNIYMSILKINLHANAAPVQTYCFKFAYFAYSKTLKPAVTLIRENKKIN